MRDTLQPAAQGGEAQPLAHSEGDAVIQPSPASTAARLRAARGEEGLTTLEWLLIVAAVAGLAVVAVVIVTRVVNQTADQLASANPTVAAAQESARSLVEQAPSTQPNPMTRASLDAFAAQCRRLRVSFGNAIQIVPVAELGTGGSANNAPADALQGYSPEDITGFDNVATWSAGGGTPPSRSSGSSSTGALGCFVRQTPTN
ncbi:MAG: hypothetical protein OXI97_05325 [Acidimicrobiaceae bacterium]|nr:hypothetical protein [Acidimicrobiaceae bacterium]